MNIEFGIPDHGWLNLRITDGNFFLEDEISDITNPDFISSFLNFIYCLKTGRKLPSIIMALEPHYYEIKISQIGDDYDFKIQHIDEYTEFQKLIYSTKGSFLEIIAPWFKEISKFLQRGYADPHWPEIASEQISSFNENYNSLLCSLN